MDGVGRGAWLTPPPFLCSYETACEEYLKALEELQKMSAEKEQTGSPSFKSVLAVQMQFVVNRV